VTTIRGIASTFAPARSANAGSTGGATFRIPTSPAAAGEVGATGEVSLFGMLALQEAESDLVRDRAARRRGQDLLTELAALQRALLREGADPQILSRLAGLCADLPVAADMRLHALLAEVAVRARVELARYADVR
jgi:hypothetical protein